MKKPPPEESAGVMELALFRGYLFRLQFSRAALWFIFLFRLAAPLRNTAIQPHRRTITKLFHDTIGTVPIWEPEVSLFDWTFVTEFIGAFLERLRLILEVAWVHGKRAWMTVYCFVLANFTRSR